MKTLFLFLRVSMFLAALAGAQAQTFNQIYSFTDGADGAGPFAAVVQDQTGNLYGTAGCCGGQTSNGEVFKLAPDGTESVLYTFCSQINCADGQESYAPVVLDQNGNVYGTTTSGGTANEGVIFKIDAAGNETVLYSFTGGSDGCDPLQGLFRDEAGDLFGTASKCGSSNLGTIFKLDSAGNFTVLHSFAKKTSDGASPSYGRLKMDKFGNLYGVTQLGGASSHGVLYELTSRGKFILLHSFSGGTNDGCTPYGSVIADSAGNIYGTTELCGSRGAGTIWKIARTGQETILHNFTGSATDGSAPEAGLAQDLQGNIYGVTSLGGSNSGFGNGVIYQISETGTFTLLHVFDYSDGAYPIGEVLPGSNGTLYGTTTGGGTYGYGNVWSYVP